MIALVQEITDDILAQASHNASQGRELVANIVQALDDDATWVELYCATGELLIPSTSEIHEELRELFTSLQQVALRFLDVTHHSVYSCFYFFRGWRIADRPRNHHPRGGKSESRWIFRG